MRPQPLYETAYFKFRAALILMPRGFRNGIGIITVSSFSLESIENSIWQVFIQSNISQTSAIRQHIFKFFLSFLKICFNFNLNNE